MTDPFDDELLDALASERRRQVCRALAAVDGGALSLERLAERVATDESRRTTRTKSDRAGTIAVELHHVHLPKLDDAGLLEFDYETGTVYYETHPVVESVAGGDGSVEAAHGRPDAE